MHATLTILPCFVPLADGFLNIAAVSVVEFDAVAGTVQLYLHNGDVKFLTGDDAQQVLIAARKCVPAGERFVGRDNHTRIG